MSTETDRHGYEGNAPIHLGRDLHIDQHAGGRFFVTENPDAHPSTNIYVSRLELIEAARNILRHFGASS